MRTQALHEHSSSAIPCIYVRSIMVSARVEQRLLETVASPAAAPSQHEDNSDKQAKRQGCLNTAFEDLVHQLHDYAEVCNNQVAPQSFKAVVVKYRERSAEVCSVSHANGPLLRLPERKECVSFEAHPTWMVKSQEVSRRKGRH